MFIGHFAVGFAAKKAAPRPSLGTFFIGVALLDLIWPVLLIIGVERVEVHPGDTAFTPLAFVHYPWSHSLIMTILWAFLFSGAYWIVRRDRKGAAWLWVAVFSHWVLDTITHRPDLPLYPGSTQYTGLGLWNSPTGTIVVEGLMFIAGIYIYATSTTPKRKLGSFALWSLVVFLAVSYAASIMTPPPPDVKMLGWGSLSVWILVAWGYWVDRNRSPRLSAH